MRGKTKKMGRPKAKSEQECSDAERIFCAEYMIHFNGTQSAKEAGYKQPALAATRLLKRPRVQRLLAEYQRRALRKREITAERVLDELACIAFLDARDLKDEDGNVVDNLHKLPGYVSRAVKSLKVLQITDKKGNVVGQQINVEAADKNDALKTLSKHLGLLQPDLNVQGDVNVNVQNILSVEDLDVILKSMKMTEDDILEVKRRLLGRLRERMGTDGSESRVIDAESRRIENKETDKKVNKKSRKSKSNRSKEE